MLINNNIKLKLLPSELHHFSWLNNVAPCFPISSAKVNIITDPRKFYETISDRFKNAKRRISVASLYIGTGSLERQLLEETRQNMKGNTDLKFNVLIDYQRGTRGEVNSRSLLQCFINDMPECCNIFLYQTPRLHGSWSKALPARYNEIMGLQHMKLYIADDSVILSGANCSSDYFSQRQDRYVEIENAELANFYYELIEEVGTFSKRWEKKGLLDNMIRKRGLVVQDASLRISSFINKWKEKQDIRNTSSTNEVHDTWVFPLIQMGEFQITQDERATMGMLASAPAGSNIRLATGYFNLTDQYASTLLKDCKSNISLLMAHPNANGFMGAAGPAGGIPHAYSLIARQFWQRVLDTNQEDRIEMLEYERDGWTFHAKGLWYYPPGSGVPWATLVGSANLGERSVRRDLEAQAAILTTSPQLQERLHGECSALHEYASECSHELQGRRTPLWVRATVGLFRTYF